MRALYCLLLLACASTGVHAEYFSGIYFFGDSLSDVGNVKHYAGKPLPPYDLQGRASNGPIYADTLAAGLGFTASPSTGGGNDFAFGGARTRYQLFGPPFQGILEQIGSFAARPGSADPGALYVVWGGSNNVQDLVLGKTVDVLGQPIPNLAQSVGDLIGGIRTLHDDGARRFLVPNVPDLGLVPRVRELGNAAMAYAHALSTTFDALLATALTALEAELTDIEITSFDTYLALNDMAAHPGSYGLSDITHRCYTGDDLTFTGGGDVCANPDSYLFWDGIHPTSAVHGILGRQMLAVLPEPGSLALMSLALLLLGIAGTRQRKI